MAFRTTHFYVERLMVYSQNGFIHMDGSTTVSSIPGQWVGGSSFPMGGSTSVQFTVTGGGVIPRMRLNQSILGGPQADDEVVGQYRLAQKLGRFPLGGGHLPSWPGKFGTLSIGGQTGVAIGSQKNGIGDEFTSKFGLNISKLCNFTLGFGGTIGVRNISGSLGLVGSTDFTISGTSFTVASADWFKQISPVILNNSFRNPLNEYVHRKDWVQYPTLTNITTTHEGLNYIDLNAFVRPSSLRIIAPDPYVFNQVNFLTNISAWPAMSDASGTVAGKTFRSNPFLCFNYHKVLTDRKLPITYTLGIIGNTSTTISSQYKGGGTYNITAGTGVVFLGSQVYRGTDSIAGSTDVRFTGQIYQDGPITFPGATDVQFTPLALAGTGWQSTGQTLMSITLPFGTYWEGQWEGDGSTSVSLSGQFVNGCSIPIPGVTTFTILSNQLYNAFVTMAGTTSVAFTAYQKYAESMQWDGVCNTFFTNSIRQTYGEIITGGSTNFRCDAIADYFIAINGSGATDVNWGNSLVTNSQIFCGPGITNLYIDSLKGLFMYATVSGVTNVVLDSQALYNVSMFWFLNTGVAITAQTITLGYFNMAGSSSMGITSSQNQHGEVVCDQINQTMTSIGSFIYTDGESHPAGSSTVTLTSKLIPLGPQYYSALIENNKSYNTEISTMSFTLSGQTSRSVGTGNVGSFVFDRSVGFTRQMGSYSKTGMVNMTTEEYVKIPLYVYNSKIVETSSSIGFTLAGDPSTGGIGVLGYLREDYATIGILTNVRNTQNSLEILANGNPNVDVTQICYELLYTKTPASIITQVAKEVLYLANLAAINSLALEALAVGDSNALVDDVAVEAIFSIRAATLSTQETLEILTTGDPNVQETQTTLEILTLNQLVFYANSIINNVAVEAIGVGQGNVSINAEAVECLFNNAPKAWVNHEAIETIHNNSRNGLLNHEAIEILNNGHGNGLVQHIAVEMLVKPEFDPEVAGMINNPRYHIG